MDQKGKDMTSTTAYVERRKFRPRVFKDPKKEGHFSTYNNKSKPLKAQLHGEAYRPPGHVLQTESYNEYKA